MATLRQIYQQARSTTAETARGTTTSVVAVDRLTLTQTLDMTYINIISLTELSIRGLRGMLYPAVLCPPTC